MDIFDLHRKILNDYRSFVSSFINIRDERIDKAIREALASEKLWPSPLLQLNPSYERTATLGSLVQRGLLQPSLPDFFGSYQLYQHQIEAIELGATGKDFIVTSGTGSGKSLTYLATIFNEVLRYGSKKGIQALIVYPTNALINSQTVEIEKYRKNYEAVTGKPCPIRAAQYTGQEDETKRERVREEEPQIVLTNYMMLELIMTRTRESRIRESLQKHLRFLVYDELHTYRGRQGADVGVLNRRVRSLASHPVLCIGTSATMATGTREEQRRAVAEVATKIFGKTFTPEQVIDEKLKREFEWTKDEDLVEALVESSRQPSIELENEDAVARHPLASWLESRVGLEFSDGRWIRRKPVTQKEAAQTLSEETGLSETEAAAFLERFLMAVAALNRKRDEKGESPLLPFKLHQFIAQTGSVYVTLEPPSERHITLEAERYIVLENKQSLPLYPVVFSRVSGHEMLCVRRLPDGQLLPRDFYERTRPADDDEEENDLQNGGDGYLIFEHEGEAIWTPEDVENLPPSWRLSDGRIREKYKHLVPRPVSVDPSGRISDDDSELPHRAWYLAAPFQVDPTSGIVYNAKTSDYTKVTQLGSEARSTSTSVLSYATVQELDQAGADPTERKLLSFVDNRQDASLQSGHFNDFLRVIQLRSAVYKAVSATPNGLTVATLGSSVARALNLPEIEYARQPLTPGPFRPPRNPNTEALEQYLFYRALHDLRRSWRIVLPNLEQCGLLSIEYQDLDDYATQDSGWATLPGLKDASPETRMDIIRNVLDYFRRQFAIAHHDLEPERLKENEKIFRERLILPWSLDQRERLPDPLFMVLKENKEDRGRRQKKSLGYTTQLGFYLRSRNELKDHLTSRADYDSFIGALLHILTELGYLRSEKNHQTDESLWRLVADKLVWKAGDGQTPAPDIMRYRSLRDVPAPRVNTYFRDTYRTALDTAVNQRGEEHTAMVSREDRIQRENEFRDGKITALFCSPTMELGIDIAKLTVVHMRNVPPSPANYTQRSGRAGRSGQGALIMTYCASQSPHDMHYFANRTDMVAGVVAAPNLDLANEELLRAHLHALYLATVKLTELEGSFEQAGSLGALIDLSKPSLPIIDSLKLRLKLDPGQRQAVCTQFLTATKDLHRYIPWLTEDWVLEQLDAAPARFNEALERWRLLYRVAERQRTEAEVILADPTIKENHPDRKRAWNAKRQALRQRDLLLNATQQGSQESEFYPYRYLASAGFLPGYNFFRLPIRAFLGDGDSGTFVSRGRLVAIREFGPHNLIYFNRAKYDVNQLEVTDVDSALIKARVAKESGYFLTGEELTLNHCPLTDHPLLDNTETLENLIEMNEVRAERRDNITCEEEERVRSGYDVRMYLSFVSESSSSRKLRLHDKGNTLINLRFLPAARLHAVNHGWSFYKEKGFLIRKESRFIERSLAPKDPEVPRQLIKLTTSITADALYLHPTAALALKEEGILTLQYTLQKAIEQTFMVERGEIGVELLGSPPNILLYEASEGSLGVMRRLTEDPLLLPQVFEAAWQILHFHLPPEEEQRLPKASYKDILSYYNQRHHNLLDRHLVRPALEKLRACEIEAVTGPFDSYEEQYQDLLSKCDPNSMLEKRFLKHLYEKGLRLPDAAQVIVEGLYVKPDFFYSPNLYVFIDGSVHDDPAVAAADEMKRRAMRRDGKYILVYRYDDNLDELLAEYAHIIKPVK